MAKVVRRCEVRMPVRPPECGLGDLPRPTHLPSYDAHRPQPIEREQLVELLAEVRSEGTRALKRRLLSR